MLNNISNLIVQSTKQVVKSTSLPRSIDKIHFSGLQGTSKLSEPATDVFGSTKKLVPADDSLFTWATKKPEFSLDNFNTDGIALVHSTKYYPTNGEILSDQLATLQKDGVGEARTTIHFCINKPVTEHALGNAWNTMDYVVILPFDKVLKETPKSKVIGGLNEDFMFQDKVKLPKGSVIVKYNPNVPENTFLTSDAMDGIKLVETSNRKTSEAADTVIKKMGYTTYNDALQKHLNATDEEMKILTSIPESELLGYINLINKNGGVTEARKTIENNWQTTKNLFEKDSTYADYYTQQLEQYKQNMYILDIVEKRGNKLENVGKGCRNFCEKNNLFSGLHSQSPWFFSELGLTAINLSEKLNNNSWGENLKTRVIEILSQAKQGLPEGKSVGYDVDKAIELIEKSETPAKAKELLAQELKIKNVTPRGGENIDGSNSFWSGEAGVNLVLDLMTQKIE